MKHLTFLLAALVLFVGTAYADACENKLVGAALNPGQASAICAATVSAVGIDSTITSGGLTLTSGDLTITSGALSVPAAASLSLTGESGANTACNTTCTLGCIAGFDAGTSVFVACDGATADTCLCAGS